MARTRQGSELIDDSYKRADLEGATDRTPRTEVLRYVNQGVAATYDLLIEARGRTFYAKKPAITITTTASTSRYLFGSGGVANDFYRLSSVRVGGAGGFMLSPFSPQDEPVLREPGVTADKPTHYEIQPGYIELLPLHSAAIAVVVDYVPHSTDLTDGSTTFDGINGWEEYAVCYAACCMLTKDDEQQLKNSILGDMAKLEMRISKLASKRDAFRAERVKNVRGGGVWRGRYY